MDFVPGSSGSVAAFVGVVAGVLVAFLAGVHRAWTRTGGQAGRATALVAGASLAWLGLLSAGVASGAVISAPMPGLPIFFGVSLGGGLAIGLSRLGGRLAQGLTLTALVGFQGFRLPLELILHAWGESGTIPMTMTWEGSNLDVVSGALALLCAPLVGRWRGVAWLANVVGFVLLVNVGRVAILSSPLPFAWPDVSPRLALGMVLPYAWIGPVCVGGALAGHVILTRALLRAR
jgi:hypothetical protein